MSSLLDALQRKIGGFSRTVGVKETADLRRILALPRRDWHEGIDGSPAEMAELLTKRFKTPTGEMTLRELQAVALTEFWYLGGFFGGLGVGTGKTLVSFLAPALLEKQRPLLLIPAALREKTDRDFAFYSQHWRLPSIRVESYELLGRTQSANYLDDYSPDIIVADEAHKLKRVSSSACAKRVRNYLEKSKTPVSFLPLTGSAAGKSMQDYWHLMGWALGDQNMPMPIKWPDMIMWSDALDPRNYFNRGAPRTAPGALLQFLTEEELRLVELKTVEEMLPTVREGYRRRLASTPGVLFASDDEINSGLRIDPYRISLPDDVHQMIEAMSKTFETPDGHPFESAAELWRHQRELACGFFYKWEPRPSGAWLSARRLWSKFVRRTLKHSRTYESPEQVELAVVNGELSQDFFDELNRPLKVYDEWLAVRDTFKPVTEPVWIHDLMVVAAISWMARNPNGIVWVEHRAFGERLEERSGISYFRKKGLDLSGRYIEDVSGPIIASIHANREGRNLQKQFHQNLIVSCEPNGQRWEQMLGRTHRSGQTADEVEVSIAIATGAHLVCFWRAHGDALFTEQTTGAPQKLVFADKNMPAVDAAMLSEKSYY